MADKKQRAWVASEDGEGHSVVIFHHHGLAARREGANALGMEFDEVECKRAPHFDSFADQGHVPPLDLLKAGWWFECHSCGHRICEDEYDLDLVVQTADQLVFCNTACQQVRATRVLQVDEAFNNFKEKVQAHRPDLTFTRFTGGYPILTPSADFKFKGCRWGGTARMARDGKVAWYIAQGDRDAWDLYEAGRAMEPLETTPQPPSAMDSWAEGEL